MTAFAPLDQSVLSGGLALFSKVMVIMTGLVSVIFIMRISLLVVKVAGPHEYGELIKDTVSFLAMSSLFPILMNLIVSSVTSVATRISFIPNEAVKNSYIEFMQNLFSDVPLLWIVGKMGHLLIQGLSYSIYTISISLLLAAAPIFVFLSTMLGLSSGLKIYFGLLISLCLWPVLWNILGQLGNTLSAQNSNSPLLAACFFVVLSVLQLLSPLLSYSLFKSMSLGGGKVMKVVSLASGLGGKS